MPTCPCSWSTKGLLVKLFEKLYKVIEDLFIRKRLIQSLIALVNIPTNALPPWISQDKILENVYVFIMVAVPVAAKVIGH
jgi:hypothetical protein